MQAVLREKLMAQAMKLSGVSAVYRGESHRFVEVYLNWLEEAEKDLSGLRSPVGVLLQAEKSLLNSVMDGYLPDNIKEGRSIRKIQKAVAAQSLEKVSRELSAKIVQIDSEFDQTREKLCHAVAILASRHPELYATLHADQSGVDAVWKLLGATPDTMPMYNYFCAKLAATDVGYLLLDLIQNIIGNRNDFRPAHHGESHRG
ncbi:MAG: hypothetical protein ACOYL3_10610 [Desulfuromonadaceae bacterium]